MELVELLKPENEALIAKDLGVSVHTVRKWRQRARVPSRRYAFALIRWSRGMLTLDAIYQNETKAA